MSVPTGAINIVLLGSDQRPDESSWRTDVVIVVSVNPNIPTVTMWSIPRDTWLYIPNWTYNRINLADTHGQRVGYPGGGPGLIKATIEYNFGIHIDYFARVDFAGLMRIVDTLGGIEVLLECPVEDGFPDDPITEDPSVVTQISYPEPGLYHIDGKHALWLSRSRKTTSEFARSRRQHRVLLGIYHKAKQLGLITRIPELWEELTATVQTDLSLDEMLWLAQIGLQLDPTRMRSGFIDGSMPDLVDDAQRGERAAAAHGRDSGRARAAVQPLSLSGSAGFQPDRNLEWRGQAGLGHIGRRQVAAQRFSGDEYAGRGQLLRAVGDCGFYDDEQGQPTAVDSKVVQRVG